MHGHRGILIFLVQLTTSRIGNLTPLIHTLLYVMTIHTYIRIYCLESAGAGRVVLKVVPVTGAAFSGITLNQLMSAFLFSHPLLTRSRYIGTVDKCDPAIIGGKRVYV